LSSPDDDGIVVVQMSNGGAHSAVPDPPKLLDRVRDAIRLRHYSPRTGEAYVSWIRRYVVFNLTADDVAAFKRWRRIV
jgi:hypothetical protein